MSYTNQTTSSLADLIDKLQTFLGGTPGYTVHHAPGSGEVAFDKNPSGSLWVTLAGQWDTGGPNHMGVYQWHGNSYDSGGGTGTVPYDQDDDSGNGAASTTDATLGGQRHVTISNTPQQFWCFEDDDYFHVVVQRDDDDYEHFGAGILTKYNDFTGGEYCYGHRQDTASTSSSALQGSTSILLDGFNFDANGVNNMEEYSATLHLEGFAEQTTELWAVVMGNQSSSNLGTARNADARVHVNGGFRGGLYPTSFGQFAGTVQRGLIPFYPIICHYWNRTTDDVMPLGEMPDVRGCSMANFSPGQEVTVGSDTWVVFPSARKATADTLASAGYSAYQGVAYKKVTT